MKLRALSSANLLAFAKRFPVLAELILARNIVNTDKVEEFVKAFHVEDMPELNTWLDTAMRKYLINRYDKVSKYTPKASDPDWMKSKTDLESVVLDNVLSHKIQHVVDFMKNTVANDSSFKLSSFQAEEAFKQADAWTKKLQKKKTGEEEEGKDFTTIMKLDGGWAWVDVISETGLAREGKLMGHCVGGYWDRVKAGAEKILSLRDPQNEPHATIEYHPKAQKISQIKGKQNRALKEEYMQYLLAFLKSPPVPIRKMDEHDMQANGLVKAADGYLSLLHLPAGSVIDQSLDLRKFSNVTLPIDLTINGGLLVGKNFKLSENLTVKGMLNLAKSSIYELPAGLKVGSLNIFGLDIEKLPADIQIKNELNAEFSSLKEIPPLKLSGDLTLSDTNITELPPGIKVGGELDLMNTSITKLPEDLKAKVIFVDDPEAFPDAPPKLKDLLH